MVFMRYELGSYWHYASVAFTGGRPWRVGVAQRQLLEARCAASGLCTAVRCSDNDVAILLVLAKLRGADALYIATAAL
jgi:hypothetical protein